MTADPPLGRIVLRLVVASLLVAGAAACVALLRGELSDVDWKIIASSTLLALVSATTGSGLAARHRQPALGWATAVLSLAAFVLVLAGMWPELDGEAFWRATGVVAIGALEGAHASFVISRRRADDPRGAIAATRIAVAAAALSGAMGVVPLVVEPPENVDAERYAQVLGVVLVIQLVATAVAPILRRLGRDRPAAEDVPAAVPALAPGDRLADEIVAVADRIERLAPGPLVADECERLRRLARGARAA
jgi:uncharacterized membrane protein